MMKRHAKWLAVLAAIALLLLVLLYNGRKIAEQANRPMPARQETTLAADVAVVQVTTGRYAPTLEAFGSADAHYRLSLTTQVAGRVARLADSLEAGQQVRRGSVLVQLEDTDYRATLASAEKELASARLDLLEAEREAAQAQAEWRTSGMEGEPDSPLVLHEPQLALARAAVAEAEAAVTAARQDLDRTRIQAPFDALVVERNVSPGSYLQAGGEVAQLYSTDRVEIALPLSQRDWAKLPDLPTLEAGDWPVTLISVETGERWQGYVRRAERHLDDSNRQRALAAAVDQPLAHTPPLAPGTFVRAEIPGRELTDLWRLPPSALSQRGEIWYVADGALATFAAEPVASDAQALYIQPPESLRQQTVQVLTHPLSSYVPGMAVHPVEAQDE
ncbi:efflux RND transporter periplasmic adaptor subunit [uncultured Marinobacter sp.]|jgi:RND family efflux transporter MFP subunit|uniref:efflux RND transporter periplasmic adaptor subunit n=1 Tax=uncultured Marinobacter sp. TaxID=187379 RepID=UPI000C6267B6|nr:efflux transporter periplasmic adaptor subunit [Oceanospirillales bacterium]